MSTVVLSSSVTVFGYSRDSSGLDVILKDVKSVHQARHDGKAYKEKCSNYTRERIHAFLLNYKTIQPYIFSMRDQIFETLFIIELETIMSSIDVQ